MDEMTEPGVMSAVLAYLGENYSEDQPFSEASKTELETAIGHDVGYELLYLRDRDCLKILSAGGEEVFAVLKPGAADDAGRLAKVLESDYGQDYDRMAREHQPKFIDYPGELDWDAGEPPTREELGDIESTRRRN
ncbi:MAG: hypothetical protein ABEJ69_01025 [Candidatus Nanohaloarchaea archaeon]